MTPLQERIWTQVLDAEARRSDRPSADPTAGRRLAERVLSRLAPGLEALPADERLVLSGSDLDALACDGRYLDRTATPFAWTPGTAAAALVSDAVGVDLDGGQARPVTELIDHAWRRSCASSGSLGAWLSELDGVDRDAVRGDAARRLHDLRDVLPPLPVWTSPRTRVRLAWRAAPGVLVHTSVDLVVGRADPRRRLVHLLDLRTGLPSVLSGEQRRRAALLATLRSGIAPWRTTTLSTDVADAASDDVTDELLEQAADELAARITRAVALRTAPPPVARQRLRAGPWCGWCSRAPDCPLAPGAEVRPVAA